jgi:hypothetical protein
MTHSIPVLAINVFMYIVVFIYIYIYIYLFCRQIVPDWTGDNIYSEYSSMIYSEYGSVILGG